MLDPLGNIRKAQSKGIVLVELRVCLGRQDELAWHHLRTAQIHSCAKPCGIDSRGNKKSTKVEDSPHKELKFKLNLQG